MIGPGGLVYLVIVEYTYVRIERCFRVDEGLLFIMWVMRRYEFLKER